MSKGSLVLATVLFVISSGCGGSYVSAEITAFEPPEEALQSGSTATASVHIKNTGTEDHAFWTGYSVQGPNGEWHDALPSRVALYPGEESGAQELSTEPLETPGYYKSRVSVWREEPGDGKEAARLAGREEQSSFRVYSAREDFEAPALERWEAGTQKLGRGELAPENVSLENGQLRLALPEGTLDGGQIESEDLYGPGFYAARIKVPDAPSSITGFFLYHPPDLSAEIDVEIYNDSSRQVMFTTYAGGERTHTETVALPFDPTADFHDYAFLYDEGSITFYADGEPLKTYEGGLPDRPMKLYVNAWFPEWLDGEAPGSDRYVYVDWIEY